MGLRLGGTNELAEWVGDLITVSNFVVAREQSIDVNKNARIDLQISLSNNNRPSPMGVFIDLIKDSKFYGISNPKKECSFWLEFSDAAPYQYISSKYNRNRASLAQGGQVVHVFDGVKTFNITAYCFHHKTGEFGLATATATTLDPDVYYDGRTICFDPSGVFDGAPSGESQYTDFAAAASAFGSLGALSPKRFMVAKGQEVDWTAPLYFSDESMFSTFGTGLKPTLKVTNDLINADYKAFFVGTGYKNNVTITGFKFQGDYDPITGTGESYQVDSVFTLGGYNFTLYNTESTKLGSGLRNSVSQNNDPNTGFIIVDNKITDWYDYGIFSAIYQGGIRGNHIKQNPNAKTGTGGKSKDSYKIEVIDSTSTYVLSNLDLEYYKTGGELKDLGGIRNLVVFDFNPNGQTLEEMYTELLIDIDFTFTQGVDASGIGSGDGTHQITLLNQIQVGHSIYYYHRRWSDHGSKRLNIASDIHISQNEERVGPGWSSDGLAPQPCMRFNSDGLANGGGFINQNEFVGGFSVVSFAPQNTSTMQHANNPIIFEANELHGLSGTSYFIDLKTTNLVIRNCVGIMPDLPPLWANFWKFFDFVNISRNSLTDPLVDLNSIDIHNLTLINLQSSENSGTSDADDYVVNGLDKFPIINSSNHLHVHVDRTTPLPDYSPLDPEKNYQPKAGSAALDAGTKNDLVWDDITGNLIGETASLGAFDTQSEYRVNFSTLSDNYAIFTTFEVAPSSDSYFACNFNSSTAFTAVEYLATNDVGSLGSYIQIYINRMRVRLSGRILDITIPSASANYGDGDDHAMLLNLPLGGVMSVTIDGNEYFENSSYVLTEIDVLEVSALCELSAGNEFRGQVWGVDMKNSTERTQYSMTTGSVTTETATIGTGTITYINTDTDDIS